MMVAREPIAGETLSLHFLGKLRRRLWLATAQLRKAAPASIKVSC
jgi:hypothetical protein